MEHLPWVFFPWVKSSRIKKSFKKGFGKDDGKAFLYAV
jgi:hypothetical protein